MQSLVSPGAQDPVTLEDVSKLGWVDRLLRLTRGGSADQPVEGLVLSGGGSRASFHIGALRYLYDNCEITPKSFVGTSAGSIVAAMLAQSSDHDGQLAALRVLEDHWLAMTGPEEMYAEQSWFTRLRQQWDDIAQAIPETDDADSIFVDANAPDAESVVKEALNADPSTDVEFSLSMLWGLIGSLGRIGRAGASLASSLRGAELAASAYRPGPIVYRLLFESGFSKQDVRASGVDLRLAFVGLNSGELCFMRQDGVIVDASNQPVSDSEYDLALGIWASCAIPGVFRPVKLGDELFVDGGVRDNVPVSMSVTNLGVTQPYVISATPPGMAEPEFAPRDMVSVMARSLAILMNEAVRDEIAWARQAGAIIIEPLIDVHGSLTVEPGLLQINRDYGWMRAAKAMTDWTEAKQQHGTGEESSSGWPWSPHDDAARGDESAVADTTGIVDTITEARLALYRLVTAPEPPPAAPPNSGGVGGLVSGLAGRLTGNSPETTETTPSVVETAADPAKKTADEITQARQRLKALIAEADPALLPEGAQLWPDEDWPRTPPHDSPTVVWGA